MFVLNQKLPPWLFLLSVLILVLISSGCTATLPEPLLRQRPIEAMTGCDCWVNATDASPQAILLADVLNLECAATCEIPRRKLLVDWINLGY